MAEPSGQNRQKKQSEGVRFKRQCHIVKNTLLKTAFSAILPTEKVIIIIISLFFIRNQIFYPYKHPFEY